jgi:3-hydroxyacyl-CoA dehydrogenase
LRQGSGPQTIETITVIGAGTMGHGIAQVAGASAFRLLLIDVDRELILKQDILRQLEALSDCSFIFASNSSSLSITEIAKASQRPENVIGDAFIVRE